MWTFEKIIQEAIKYKNRNEFRQYSNPAYQAAKRRQILDIVCNHMLPLYGEWTNEKLKLEALNHKSRRDFQKNNCSAYHAAHRRGILNDICSHMEPKLTYWTKEMLQEEAMKYKTRGEFQNLNPSADRAARLRGIIDEICSHMEFVHNHWTSDNIKLEASKYQIRSNFYTNSPQAYRAAMRLGILDEICSQMSDGGSAPQKELYEFVNTFHPSVVENDRVTIKPQEIDVYIPHIKLGIEYCGLRWHSEQFQKDKNYHYKKMIKCSKNGTRLITIFEDEWAERKTQVKNHLLSVMGVSSIKIGARKTEIREVPKKEAIKFLKETHIQGGVSLEKAFGLYYMSELVGIITGNKHHRQSQNKIFVLNRMSFKYGVSISGGASKLLKCLISYAKNAGYNKIVSWSDNRWSEGNVYNKVGFTLTEELAPDYSYSFNKTRISKQSCQKKNLLKKGAVGSTELEMAKSLGYSRIWDCGKKRWEIKL